MTETLTNETGSVMLFTLMFILIITVMGLIATQTSVFEVKIAENSRRYSEELSAAEAALNDAIANFRNLPKDTTESATTDIAKVLNDSRNSDYRYAVYKRDSRHMNPEDTYSLAEIEVRRIVDASANLDCSASGVDHGCDICELSEQARKVPRLPHRYYAGSIDKRRFAVTATAYKRYSTVLSTTWVQKGISLPAEQDKDIL